MILNRHLPITQSTVIGFENKLRDMTPGQEQQPFVHVALGLMYCAAGHVGYAGRHYQDYAKRMGYHPELALEIGKLLLQTGKSGAACTMLQTVLADDKTRTAAHLFLAHCEQARGNLPEAEQHLLSAHKLAPAWGDILVTLADIQRRLGKPQAAREMTEKFQQQQAALVALASRLQTA